MTVSWGSTAFDELANAQHASRVSCINLSQWGTKVLETVMQYSGYCLSFQRDFKTKCGCFRNELQLPVFHPLQCSLSVKIVESGAESENGGKIGWGGNEGDIAFRFSSSRLFAPSLRYVQKYTHWRKWQKWRLIAKLWTKIQMSNFRHCMHFWT